MSGPRSRDSREILTAMTSANYCAKRAALWPPFFELHQNVFDQLFFVPEAPPLVRS